MSLNNSVIVVDLLGYESIGTFCQTNDIKTDYSLLVRLLRPIKIGDYIRLPLKLYNGDYINYTIYKIGEI